MGWIPSGNGILRIVLSASLALPNSSWAKDEALASPESQLPVFMQELEFGDQHGYVMAIPVPLAKEAEIVAGWASESPEKLALLVNGDEDPALKTAAQTGNLNKIATFVAPGADQAPILNVRDLPANLKAKVKEKLQKVTDFCKREKVGLLWAFYNASVVSAFAAYSSASVDAGAALLAGIFLWNSFLVTQPSTWEKMLTRGGDGLRKLASKAFSLIGYELNPLEKNIFTATGQFSVGWLASSVGAAGVLVASGLLTGPMQALWYGLLANYNVWDPVILKKFKNRRVSELFVKRYFAFQFLMGSIFEAASYAQVPYTQMILMTIVVSGLAYLISGRKLEKTYVERTRILRNFFKRKPKKVEPCEDLLGTIQPELAEW